MEALPTQPTYGPADLVTLDESRHPTIVARYKYRLLHGEPAWILSVRVGDEGEGWAMDAATGEPREIR